MGLVPFFVVLSTIRKETEKRKRTLHIEITQNRMERNQKKIMDHWGIEGEWSSTLNGSESTQTHILTTPYTLLQMVKSRLNRRRKNMLTNLFKTSVSKKLTALLLGAAVAILNKKLGLDLTPDELLTFLIVIGGYIAAQAHVDARKVTAGIKDSPLLQMGFSEAKPILQEIHNGINSILEDVKKNDGSQAFKDAMQAYAQIKPILDAIKHPEPVAVIVEDKVAS